MLKLPRVFCAHGALRQKRLLYILVLIYFPKVPPYRGVSTWQRWFQGSPVSGQTGVHVLCPARVGEAKNKGFTQAGG